MFATLNGPRRPTHCAHTAFQIQVGPPVRLATDLNVRVHPLYQRVELAGHRQASECCPLRPGYRRSSEFEGDPLTCAAATIAVTLIGTKIEFGLP